VVVDPGHGGRDPGATGIGGLREKDVNLSISKRLAKRLKSRGFQVILTRNDDRSLSLEERTAIAESAGGDVFISIHANASRRSKTRGIEIYTLDASHERHSLDVVSRENGVPASELDPLQRALAKLRVDEVASNSEHLAGLVHANVIAGARKNKRSLPDLGLKKGPFYVLFMSSMSSVLVETGFLTNKRDAKLLRSAKFQRELADEITRGVDQYRTQMEYSIISSARLHGEGK
jgi:N-acetylmuramoyl-L-alanine amidase